jgi:large subunit ribosomal protein L21e
MSGSHGYRAGTRDLFARAYKTHGRVPVTTYLKKLRLKDYVDIKVNSTTHKGMPHKVFHGKTGKIWNITKRAVGVVVNKRVRGRILKKRIHVRIEHVNLSRCREDFIQRIKETSKLAQEASILGEKFTKKRQPEYPGRSIILTNVKLETVTPIPYDILKESLIA